MFMQEPVIFLELNCFQIYMYGLSFVLYLGFSIEMHALKK